jgi:hypothetical protein
MKYKVGDIVKVRGDLELEKEYQKCKFASYMGSLRHRLAIIIEIINLLANDPNKYRYKIRMIDDENTDSERWMFSEEMLIWENEDSPAEIDKELTKELNEWALKELKKLK